MGLCDSRPGSASGSGTRVEDERRARQRCQQTNATANGVDHHHQLHQQLQNGSTVQPLGPLRSLLIRPASHMRGEIPLTFTLEVEALPSTPTPGIIGIPPTEGISTPVRRGLSPETVSRLIDEVFVALLLLSLYLASYIAISSCIV
jgi:hypothetical protein